jgi:spermidine synthase
LPSLGCAAASAARTWLLATGVVSLLGQVALLRELNVALHGSELVYVLALGAWLASSGSAALLGRRARAPSAARVQGGLLALGLCVPLVAALLRALPLLPGSVPGAYLPLGQQLAALVLAVAPAGLLLGLLFRWSAAHALEAGGTLAGAYALESLGAVAGGLTATVALAWGLPNLDAALLTALVALAAACVGPRGAPPSRGSSVARTLGLALAALVMLALAHGAHLDRTTTAWAHPRLLATRDTPYSRVTVTESHGQVAVYLDGALAFDSESASTEELAHLGALQCEPRRVLVLGGGAEGLVGEVLRHRPELVELVELDAALLGLLVPRLPASVGLALADPRTRVGIGDPRRFLEAAGAYDLVLVGAPEPESGQANRFYTREFVWQCARRLAPGGVLALRLRGSENILTPQQVRRTAAVERALRAVFADVLVLPGATQVLLASSASLTRDPEALVARMQARGLRLRRVTPAYLRDTLTSDRVAELAARLGSARVAPNTDARPVCYALTMLLWLARFAPRLARIDAPAGAGLTASVTAFLLLLALVALARRQPRWRGPLRVGLAGFAGMLIESALLLAYQARHGVLFQDLGLLLTLFMAGLALGAAGVDRWSRRHGARLPGRGAGALAVAAPALLGLGTAAALSTDSLPGLAASGLLLVLCGALVAVVFAHAALGGGSPGTLYAADLLGGSVGSLAASLALVPFAGLDVTALVAAALAALGLLLVS